MRTSLVSPALFRPRSLAAFALVAGLCCTPTSFVAQGAADEPTSSPAPDAAVHPLRPAERAFLVKAGETGRQQMRLAEIGLSRADRTEVRSHARQLAGDYQRISDAVDALVRRKGGIAEAPVGGTSEAYQALLANPGAGFDREFVLAASKLTESAITLFEQAASEAKDPDVRAFAAAQLPVLRAHYNTIATLKKAFE